MTRRIETVAWRRVETVRRAESKTEEEVLGMVGEERSWLEEIGRRQSRRRGGAVAEGRALSERGGKGKWRIERDEEGKDMW
jgi:hypothetical protein